MEIKRFALGVRFDTHGHTPDDSIAKAGMEALFRALSPKDMQGLHLYGGADGITEPQNAAFIAVIMGGSLKGTRQLFQKLAVALGPLLCREKPFIENNRVARLSGLAYYGQAQKDGGLTGGEGCFGLTCGRAAGKGDV